ncbi:hypothetical protein R3W88_002524 [Solanum pinnatisectum]|uniref:Uncharacterized protein n=1 Tax=Solanum pinnatisectum TaxID=50273 RepID=A0AAV9MNC1_9SOLN|nr:hypothetical protein R3W88_002524 [Solanum pinnatisectum]
MKNRQQDHVVTFIWAETNNVRSNFRRFFLRIMTIFIFFFCLLYVLYSLICFNPSFKFTQRPLDTFMRFNQENTIQKKLNIIPPEKTQLHHIVFGIGSSNATWNHRKEYVKLWWNPNKMRGFVWLDKNISTSNYANVTITTTSSLPKIMISSDTSRFRYTNKNGDRSGIRISRVLSETVRADSENVRWYVMGDDDTFFVPENLVRVLRKYDHKQYYYIGSVSETHWQNHEFSYNMAYGGGGFAISYPLAKAIEKMQDKCIQRYPYLYGSDDRMQACMAELGVPLTKEVGFHQFDLYGNVMGLLSAHPVAPLISLHHLDKIEPIFPNVTRVKALKRLKKPITLDSAGLMQQSICYDRPRKWTISVSWGYSVQINRGILPAREIEKPITTFNDWYETGDENSLTFNTRPYHGNGCQRPYFYLLSNAYASTNDTTTSVYAHDGAPGGKCKWRMADPSRIRHVEVYKKPNPNLWYKSPRRNCCRVLPANKNDTLLIDVGECRDGEPF